ncbi:Do family serine endopeptidase [Pigmentiphaga aceris]|uniref:Probable periplasmic serine endoprotease DegP-like n=1 Tax=Pigmentiphaga aceris TaxID=1940612 RepID=A0A5C0AXH3_9BURK|nr:Do family serine endopeptidase [Pigmentiphaga aceris]QEI06113.1 Do family serine endopeptidase [Pigmentiphaga aceris]
MKTLSLTRTRLMAALATAGIVGAAGTAMLQHDVHAQAAPAPLVQTSPSVALPDFAQLAQRVGPAVVNIRVSGVTKISREEAAQEDPFAQFFGRMPGQQAPRERQMRGQGSGFIVANDGVILTNAHVVKGAKEVVVKLTDRREFQAKVLGIDEKTDIAVLKIDAKNLPVVQIGKVSDVQVGQWVVAIGSPYGLENTLTAGVVSATGRSLPDDSAVPFIQTDVAVNPGNSGGPLFNLRGEVVGINSQIYSQTGGFQGLSFSIPIDVASRVQTQIQQNGHASHARMGVTVQEVDQTLAESFGLDRPTGALISSVEPDSPASKAGLRSGDIVLEAGGKPVTSSGSLPVLVTQATPGEKLPLRIWREGSAKDVQVVLADAATPAEKKASAGAASQGRLGLALQALPPGASEEGGLLIAGVAGAAAQAGVQPGDVLLSINGVPVKDTAQVRGLITKAGSSVALLIQRDDAKIFVPVRLGKEVG